MVRRAFVFLKRYRLEDLTRLVGQRATPVVDIAGLLSLQWQAITSRKTEAIDEAKKSPLGRATHFFWHEQNYIKMNA